MDSKEFFKRLQCHCKKVKQHCAECCFRDFCYCVPANYNDKLLDTFTDKISSAYWNEWARTVGSLHTVASFPLPLQWAVCIYKLLIPVRISFVHIPNCCVYSVSPTFESSKFFSKIFIHFLSPPFDQIIPLGRGGTNRERRREKMKSHEWHKGWRIGFICGMALAWIFVLIGHIAACH